MIFCARRVDPLPTSFSGDRGKTIFRVQLSTFTSVSMMVLPVHPARRTRCCGIGTPVPCLSRRMEDWDHKAGSIQKLKSSSIRIIFSTTSTVWGSLRKWPSLNTWERSIGSMYRLIWLIPIPCSAGRPRNRLSSWTTGFGLAGIP